MYRYPRDIRPDLDFERNLSLGDTPKENLSRNHLTHGFSINYYKVYRGDRHFKGGRNVK